MTEFSKDDPLVHTDTAHTPKTYTLLSLRVNNTLFFYETFVEKCSPEK